MTREPDRYDKLREHPIFRYVAPGARETVADLLAAALRREADEALERAADIAESYGCDYAGREIRALASPAAAPAAETVKAHAPDLLKECHAFLRALREWPPLATSALRHEVDAILIRFATPASPSEPAAPSLLPRVLAELDQGDTVAQGLAAELRRYIADTELAEKRVAELESALRWALGEGDEFPTRQPGQGWYWWRTELRRRAKLAARAAPHAKGEGT